MSKKDRSLAYVAALVSLATLLLYLRALGNGFVNWDDDTYILNNEHIRSLDGSLLTWAFTNFHGANWHPLTWISHAVDISLWGLDPFGHHLTNVLLHALNASLVVVLAARLIEAGRPGPQGGRAVLIAASITGILFGIHPLHVESVAWVAERKDLLSGLFFLLSILAYVRHFRTAPSGPDQGRSPSGAPRRYPLGSLALFALALLSKPMAITLPVVLLILDWHPLRRITSGRSFRAALAGKTPFFLLSIASAIVTVLAQESGGAIAPLEVYPLQTRVLVAFRALAAYLGKMAWPAGLSPYYAYPQSASLLQPEYLVPVLLAAAASACCLVIARRRPVWSAAWGYYVVTLMPVLGIIQVGNQPMADRYTYLPSLGPFLLAGLGAAWGWQKAAGTAKLGARRIAAVLLLALCAILSYRTFDQIGVWKDSIGFWNHVIEREPRVGAVPYNIRGEMYYSLGQYDRALSDLTEAIALSPTDATFYNNRGVTWEKLGRVPEAIADYDRALALDPSHVKAYYNRGILAFKQGRRDQALQDFNAAVLLDPSDAAIFNNRGIVLDSMGESTRALADFDRAIAVAPGHVSAYLNRGNAHLRSGRKDLAGMDFQTACRLGNAQGCEALSALRERDP
jgi:tetratricopeptide (TPR) repeat protein